LSDVEKEALQCLLRGEEMRNKSAHDELVRKGIVLESEGPPRIFSDAFGELVRSPDVNRSALHAVIGRLLE
jgi:hypothetical protein